MQTVAKSLKKGCSGIIYNEDNVNYGLQSGLIGQIPRPEIKSILPRKYRASMSKDTEYAYMAASQAFDQAKISNDYLKDHEVGLIFGNDGNMEIWDSIPMIEKQKSTMNVDVYAWMKAETSNANICLCNIFGLRGLSFCIGAACASSSHAIGLAATYIRANLQNMILVGGSYEISREGVSAADAIGALSLRNNDPQHASRPFDQNRDGMIPSGGAAALVLEEYEHAIARGATILAEVVGYGFSSNGIEEISMPSADGEYIAMKRALDDAGLQPSDIDYVNAHATSTITGDIEEAKALTRLFEGVKCPYISSTKSMTGHENWMAGASEAVYSILMMQNDFVAPNINLENVIDEAKDLNIVRETVYTPINTVLSNSSGMGGTNSALVFRKI